MSHDIIHFKIGLKKEISMHMTLHKFETIDSIFQAALEIEREINERSAYKAKGHQGSSSWTKNKEEAQSSSRWNKPKNPPSNAPQPVTKAAQHQPPRNEGKPNTTSTSKGF